MKTSMYLISPVVLLASIVWLGRATPAVAADGAGRPGDRLERLERRVNEIAERQEQMMRRLEGPREPQAPVGPALNEPRRPQFAPVGAPMPPERAQHAPKLAKSLHDLLGLLFLIGILCNILLAIWIFTDIRKRGEGSGLFIALALVAGIPAAIIYSLVRIGDKKT